MIGEYMKSGNELNAMEREMVLQYIKNQDAQITVNLETPPCEEIVCNEAIFPVGIPTEKLSVYPNGAFVFDYSVRAIEPFVDKNVRVQFYYNHLGMYFISKLVKTVEGYAVIVPPKLHKMGDVKSYSKDNFTATISYTVQGEKDMQVLCVPDKNYDLFSKPKWKNVESYLQSAMQQYYERFVYDLSPSETDDISYLISVCRYITKPVEIEPVEGTAKPFSIIYIDTNRIVLACTGEPALPLKNSSEYKLNLQFEIFATDFFKRSIETNLEITDIYSGKNKQRCFVCKISNLQSEDERFIFEKFSGKKTA